MSSKGKISLHNKILFWLFFFFFFHKFKAREGLVIHHHILILICWFWFAVLYDQLRKILTGQCEYCGLQFSLEVQLEIQIEDFFPPYRHSYGTLNFRKSTKFIVSDNKSSFTILNGYRNYIKIIIHLNLRLNIDEANLSGCRVVYSCANHIIC